LQDYAVVTHTDIDGVAAAALYAYLQDRMPVEVVFVEPYAITRALTEVEKFSDVAKVVFTDLGLNRDAFHEVLSTFEALVKRGVALEWYDHHVWDQSWIEGLEKIGVVIRVERSTCATGVVAKYAPRARSSIDDLFISELVRGVCAGDLFRFDHWRGPWYLRLIRRQDSREWRMRVFEVIASGTLWINEFTDRVVERVESELRSYSGVEESMVILEYDGLRIAVALSNEDVENSFLAAYIMGRFNVDVVALSSVDGKISLRSRSYNVRDLAYRLGGGGHLRAAGCKLKVPWKIRLKALISREEFINYVAGVLTNALKDLGRLKRVE